MRPRAWRNTALAFLLAMIFLPEAASAQSPAPAERAKRAWKRGQELFQKHNYQGALEEFADGYDLTHKGGFLYNMAECARMMDNKDYARDLYQSYLNEFPTGSYASTAKTLCDGLGRAKCYAKQDSASASPAQPAPTQATAAASKPKSSPAPATRSKLALHASAASQPALHASAASQPARAPYLPPAGPPAPAQPTPHKPFYKHWGFWAGVGGAVVLATAVALAVTLWPEEPPTPAADFTVDFR